MKVKDFLRKYNVLSKEISNVDFHMNLLNVDLEELKRRIPELKDKNDQEVLKYISLIFKKCDSSSPEYDSKLDEEMVRIGLRTDKFYGGHNNNIWNNGMFHDDGFGFGTEPISIYDDYIDNEAERKL